MRGVASVGNELGRVKKGLRWDTAHEQTRTPGALGRIEESHTQPLIGGQESGGIAAWSGPDDRQLAFLRCVQRLLAEVNRPTFSRLSPPLNAVCRFLSFSALRDEVRALGPRVRHMRPEFLDDLAESCLLGEA